MNNTGRKEYVAARDRNGVKKIQKRLLLCHIKRYTSYSKLSFLMTIRVSLHFVS